MTSNGHIAHDSTQGLGFFCMELEMQQWSPITDEEFDALVETQYRELNDEEVADFKLYRVCPWKAIIRRSDIAGDEPVFVVAELPGGAVVYFDDVEYGFNVSPVDANGRITQPGGNQCTLKDAVGCWWPKWRIPICFEEFCEIFDLQYRELNDDEKMSFNLLRVSPWRAVIRRSESAPDEPVFVVAELPDGSVLYFNDAKHSFNVAPIDSSNRITDFRDEHNSLKDAIHRWFPAIGSQTT